MFYTFTTINAMYGKIGRAASEETVLELGLLRAKCLPVVLYATEACPLLSRRDKQSLEFTLTRLFMKIFRTASPAVV